MMSFVCGGVQQVGDQIVEINDHSTQNMTHAEAIELIQSGSSNIRLMIKRTPAVRQPGYQPSAWPRGNVADMTELGFVAGFLFSVCV